MNRKLTNEERRVKLEQQQVTKTSDGHWLWKGHIRPADGYGQICIAGKSRTAHAYAWELFHGEMPEGAEIDHKCDVRHCVNVLDPEHVRAVPRQVNLQWAADARTGNRKKGTVSGTCKSY